MPGEISMTSHDAEQQESALSQKAGDVDVRRRRLLAALPLSAMPALLFSPPSLAQDSVAVQKLHSFAINVSDLERSLVFYQDVFGAAIQAREADRISLRIGNGPRCFILQGASADRPVGFSHIGLSVADFDLDRVQQQLRGFAVQPAAPPAPGSNRLDSAMSSWVQQRGETRELFFADHEGIRYQLLPEDYCGGQGALGTVCESIEAAPESGLFELLDINHFTSFLANRSRANDFITAVFSKQFQAFQGPLSPVIGIGDGRQFLMYIGGSEPGRPANPGRIHHVSVAIADFDVAAIRRKLSDYGLQARPEGAAEQALMHWVSMRMPDRGGAEGGTPEVYFSDPDGIRIQMQDAAYCGGGGYLGDSCPPLN
jgi:catechol 2,3-dioxygenase-like lactoylglutathione lyase family enzyme